MNAASNRRFYVPIILVRMVRPKQVQKIRLDVFRHAERFDWIHKIPSNARPAPVGAQTMKGVSDDDQTLY